MSQIIQGLTDQPKQEQPIKLPDGTTATLSLTFIPQQNGWFYDLSWDGLTPSWQNNGNCLVTGPNILRQYKNQIPFGLTVSTTDNQDPSGQEDFVNGRCTLVLLDPNDVIAIEATYFPGL